MHREYILLNGFRKAKKVFTAGFHVPLSTFPQKGVYLYLSTFVMESTCTCN